MLGTYLVFSSQRSTYMRFRQCCISHFYHNLNKESVYNGMRYCSFVKNKDSHLYEIKKHKFTDVTSTNTLGTNVELNEAKGQDISKLSETVHNEDNSEFISQKKFNMETWISKKVQRQYLYPNRSIGEIYKIVGSELKDQTILTTSCKLLPESQLWEHTYTVKWPEIKSFQGISKRKSSAANVAALKCLQWLEMNRKLKHGKPIIYDKKQFMNMRHNLKISVTPKDLGNIKKLIDIYDEKIQTVLEQADYTSAYEPKLIPFDYPMFGMTHYSDIGFRNLMLQNRLSTRPAKDIDLPIFEFKDKILSMIKDNQVILIEGDTGCGKTTQVPQFIIDSYTQNGKATDCNILVSQPRRISAVSLADRVAYERGEKVGDVVGYQVKLDKVVPNEPGVILFCTTGILLKKLQISSDLKECSHVILDEAHERSIDTDLLMLLLKRAIAKNPKIKVIIMSATINSNLFMKYFNCPVIKIPGRMYPVEMKFLEDIEKLPNFQEYKPLMYNFFDDGKKIIVNYEKIVQIIKWISVNQPHGAILCFLPGWNEIMQVQKMLDDDPLESEKQLILPIHSKETSFAKHQIFQETPKGTRKIILATDIAETGITISDVCYVVDSVIRKDVLWCDEKDVLCINNAWVSQANVQQRKGRAGRVKPGFSYHLIERKNYENLQPYPLPEILRSSLEQIILDGKTYTNEKAKDFLEGLLEPPLSTRIERGVDYLINLGALNHEENLTALGKRMALFPMHPKFSKAMVLSSLFNCVEPIAIITSAFANDDTYFTSVLDSKQAIRDVKSLYHPSSDHIAFFWLFKSWNSHKTQNIRTLPTFCRQMKLRHNRMVLAQQIQEMYVQYLVNCRLLPKNMHNYFDSETKHNQYSENDELVRSVLYSATQQLIEHSKVGLKNGVMRTDLNVLRSDNGKAILSGDSVNFKRTSWPSPFLTYFYSEHCNLRRHLVIRESSMISPLSVLLFNQGKIQCDEQDDRTNIKVNLKRQSFNFYCDKRTANIIVKFRDIMWAIVQYNLKKRGVDFSNDYESTVMSQYTSKLIATVAEIIQTSAKYIENDGKQNVK